jgi:hypothetical protein
MSEQLEYQRTEIGLKEKIEVVDSLEARLISSSTKQSYGRARFIERLNDH